MRIKKSDRALIILLSFTHAEQWSFIHFLIYVPTEFCKYTLIIVSMALLVWNSEREKNKQTELSVRLATDNSALFVNLAKSRSINMK